MRFKLFGGADCSDMFLAQLVPIVALSQSGDINELQEVAAKVIQLLLLTSSSSSNSSTSDHTSSSSSESILADLQNTFIGSTTSSSSNHADQQQKLKKGEQQQQQQKSSNNNNNIELGLACCALHTIFTNIAIYNLDVQQSNKELIILGLSESAASVLSELAVSNRRDILASMSNQVRMAPNIARIHVAQSNNNKNKNNGEEEEEDDDDLPPGEERPVSYTVSLDRRLVSSSSTSSGTTNNNKNDNDNNVISFDADSESLKSLLAELIVAREAM